MTAARPVQKLLDPSLTRSTDIPDTHPLGLLKYPPSRPTELVSVGFGLPHSLGCVRIRKCEGPKPTGASPVGDTSTAPRGCSPMGRGLMLRRCSQATEKSSKKTLRINDHDVAGFIDLIEMQLGSSRVELTQHAFDASLGLEVSPQFLAFKHLSHRCCLLPDFSIATRNITHGSRRHTHRPDAQVAVSTSADSALVSTFVRY